MGSDKRQDMLGQFVDKRVLVTGYFDKHSPVYRTSGNIHTSLIQDCYLEVEKQQHDLGHCWVQFTDELKRFDLVSGTKIKFSARVKQYKKYNYATHRAITGGTPY